jgi:hypothetical protein
MSASVVLATTLGPVSVIQDGKLAIVDVVCEDVISVEENVDGLESVAGGSRSGNTVS